MGATLMFDPDWMMDNELCFNLICLGLFLGLSPCLFETEGPPWKERDWSLFSERFLRKGQKRR
jgi:hypothetical protein